jgi:hypothetical protein
MAVGGEQATQAQSHLEAANLENLHARIMRHSCAGGAHQVSEILIGSGGRGLRMHPYSPIFVIRGLMWLYSLYAATYDCIGSM